MRDARIYLSWLERYDRDAIEAVDLHYVAGLCIREIARVRDTPVENVLRSLRDTKHALNLQL